MFILLHGLVVNHRSDEDLFFSRIANFQFLNSVLENLQEIVLYASLDIDPAGCTAFLAPVAKGATNHTLSGFVEVGFGSNDSWVLASHLRDERFRIGLAIDEFPVELHADIFRPGERDP